MQTAVANAEKMDFTVQTYVTVLMINRVQYGKKLSLTDDKDDSDED